MPGRPTHAVTHRAAVLELPLWLAWRAVDVVRWARFTVRQCADLGPDIVADAAPRMTWLAIGACLADIGVTLAGHFI